MRKVIAACVGFLFTVAAFAQRDTAMLLREVQVRTTRFEQFNSGSKVQQMDSMVMLEGRYTNLSDLLGTQSQVFVKSYGLGGIATTSFRGAGAAHTAVLWNGFNLQSPMHGEFDFSLVPVYLIDEVKVQYGGNGALFGSGAVGGAVHLDNNPTFGSGWNVGTMAQAGSFGHMANGFKFGYGGGNYAGTTKLFFQRADNDFSFRNTAQFGSPEIKQQNAEVGQNAVLSSHAFRLSRKDMLNVHFWYQFANRNIPPSMTKLYNYAFQVDETYRGVVEWKRVQSRSAWSVRQAILDEQLTYEDPDAVFVGKNHAVSSVTEAEAKFVLHPKWQFNIGLNNTYTEANADGYNGYASMNRAAVFYSLKAADLIKNISITAGMRHEMVDNKLVPSSPSLGADWMITKWLKLSGVASASYRVPTFNNRYWKPGGNPDLLPERGTGQELSIRAFRYKPKFHVDVTVTGFNRNVNNWIIWLPKEGYWTPQNIRTVWSRGGELSAKLGFTSGRWHFSGSTQFNYVLSTNEELTGTNDGSLGKQLIYTPRMTHQHELRIAYRRIFLAYNHNYTGIRFTTSDNTEWLLPYQLASVLAGVSGILFKTDVTLHFKVNNMWNETYQALQWRPMPPANYMLTLLINLNIKPNQKS